MLPVAIQVPLSGSYSSVDAEGGPPSAMKTLPTTSTVPSSSRVAVWSARSAIILPVAFQAAAACSPVVEDAEADASGVALGPLLEVADGDASVHPMIADSKAAPASPTANRLRVLAAITS